MSKTIELFGIFFTEIQWNLARTNWPRVTTNSITFLRFPKKLELSRNHFLKDNCRQNLQFCTTIYLNLNDDHHLCHFYKQKLHFGKKKAEKTREKRLSQQKNLSIQMYGVFSLFAIKMQLIFGGIAIHAFYFVECIFCFALLCIHFCCVVLICSRFFKSNTCNNRNFFFAWKSCTSAIGTVGTHRHTAA